MKAEKWITSRINSSYHISKYILKFDDLLMLIQKKMQHSFLTFVVLVTNKKGIPFRLKRLTASIEPWITLSSTCIVPLKSIKRPRGLLIRAITENKFLSSLFLFFSFNFLVCFCLPTEKLNYFKRNLLLIKMFSRLVHSIFGFLLK